MFALGLHKALGAAVLAGTVTLVGCNDGSGQAAAQSSGTQASSSTQTSTSSSSSGSSSSNGSQSTSASGSTSRTPTLSLSGTPATIAVVDSRYSFQPAVPPSCTLVVFRATGLPRWLKLDSSTGTISGTPGAADVGSTGHIAITASNDDSSASLTPFTLQVVAANSKGTTTLTWTPPSKNSDGTSITDLAGYTINYGTDPNDLNYSIRVAGANMNSFEIAGLTPGTVYYFSVTAFNAAGMDSGDSNHIDQST